MHVASRLRPFPGRLQRDWSGGAPALAANSTASMARPEHRGRRRRRERSTEAQARRSSRNSSGRALCPHRAEAAAGWNGGECGWTKWTKTRGRRSGARDCGGNENGRGGMKKGAGLGQGRGKEAEGRLGRSRGRKEKAAGREAEVKT
jgi:hypothetical protein